MFDTIAVIGLGLIGGSFSLDAQQRKLVNRVVGYDASEAHCQTAEELGVVDQAFTEWNDHLSQSTLVVLAVPVRAMVSVMETLHPWLHADMIVTDVGSVKAPVVQLMREQYPNIYFVGGHPIAGAETFGPSSARIGLFKGKNVILTPTANTNAQALEKVRQLWSAVGSNVHEMTADRHDLIFGKVSHLPHLLAYATVEAIGEGDSPEILSFFGAGLKDFSRIAASSPEMWADIFLENQANLLNGLQDFSQILDEMRKAICKEDREVLVKLLTRSKKLRDEWISSKV
ncbi:MAG: prephenate dehydrogenase/arogenate dehydrogenase family protein [SAR324 cluster bacterium]|nr:prephenate dehydrogenase/arogenate dehydrogenase family protein [SAR324 cluster bacterium]